LTGAPRALGLLVVVTLSLGGCGHDGTVTATFPSTPKPDTPALAGVVQAPNGEIAAVGRPWLRGFELLPRAYALQNVLTIGEGVEVTLSRVDPIDAADGNIGDTAGHTPVFMAQGYTDFEGHYEITDPGADDVDACRLMVAVGTVGNGTLTRAFVITAGRADIDATSEAVVRVVLDRLTKAPAVQLCDFSLSGLQNIYDAVARATATASGENISQINQNAFEKALASRSVKRAIDNATGVPVQE
jgi:hypothetical protein